jgi:hypothetical protein
MAIWTNGTDVVIATGWGIARSSGRAWSVLCHPTAGRPRDVDPPPVVSLVALDAAGERALVQRAGEPPSIWTHGPRGGRLTPCEAGEVLAVAAAPGGPMVALAVDRAGGGAARQVLRAARLDDTRLVLGDEIAVPEAPRLLFESAVMREGGGWPESPLDRDEDDEPEQPPFDPRVLSYEIAGAGRAWWRGQVRLSANRFGIGVSSTYSGLVAVLDPRTLAFRFAARAPALRDQFDLFVLPMPSGMLLTLVSNGRASEVVYVDEAGAVGGVRSKFGKEAAWSAEGPGLAWDDTTALVSLAGNKGENHTVTVPALATKRFGKEPGYVIDSGSSPDGSTHLLALTSLGFARPQNWHLYRWTKGAARWTSTEIDMPDFRPVAAPPPPALPERARGNPSLGVSADPATPWRARAGAEIVLRLRVENRGGPARGLSVEVSGAALAEGLVSVQAAGLEGGAPAAAARAGATARADLPDCALEAALVLSDARSKAPSAPLPPPAIVLELRVRAERAGQGLLSVRVGPRGATGTAGSGLVGRAFVVEAG